MRLIELNPRWWRTCDTRGGQGVSFDCPCCAGKERLAVAFANPTDGRPPVITPGMKMWQRVGDTFDTMTLAPSIDASTHGHWHGFITNGQVI